jgi:hypothetical protein
VCQVGADRGHDAGAQAPGGQPWYRLVFRRLASSTTMDAAQISPSTVNGSSRAITPDSPCERTSSYACWYEITAATATTASAVVNLMSRSVAARAPHATR